MDAPQHEVCPASGVNDAGTRQDPSPDCARLFLAVWDRYCRACKVPYSGLLPRTTLMMMTPNRGTWAYIKEVGLRLEVSEEIMVAVVRPPHPIQRQGPVLRAQGRRPRALHALVPLSLAQ
jgi:hypothetical protein